VHEEGGRAEISRFRIIARRSTNRRGIDIDEIARLRYRCVQVTRPRGSRPTQLSCQLVIVMGRALVVMAVQHQLEDIIVTVGLSVMVMVMVMMFVIGDHEDGHTSNCPHQ